MMRILLISTDGNRTLKNSVKVPVENRGEAGDNARVSCPYVKKSTVFRSSVRERRPSRRSCRDFTSSPGVGRTKLLGRSNQRFACPLWFFGDD